MQSAGSARGAKLRLLLASSSVLALLVGGGTHPVMAACAINDSAVTLASVTNAAAINCINVDTGSHITGNVTNTSTGVLTPTGAAPPTRTGITINNATIGGSVVNAGHITDADTGNAILVTNNAVVAKGITNTGLITGHVGSGNGIMVGGTATGGASVSVSTFGGGITNSGTITLPPPEGFGIWVGGSVTGAGATIVLSTFTGGVTNTGLISAAAPASNGKGIMVGVSAAVGATSAVLQTFTGGVSNSGTINSGRTGIFVFVGAGTGTTSVFSTFSGGITNSGTVTSGRGGIIVAVSAAPAHLAPVSGGNATFLTFLGNISNSGTITSLTRDGIDVVVNAGAGTLAGGTASMSTFGGSVINNGKISAVSGNGINIAASATGVGSTATLSTFNGSVTNSGTIVVGKTGIFVGAGGGGPPPGKHTGGLGSLLTFTGNILNAGTITSTSGNGILVGPGAKTGGTAVVATFAGGVTNSGTISIVTKGNGIMVAASGTGVKLATATFSTFAGSVTNSGAVLAVGSDIFVGAGAKTNGLGTFITFGGSIINSATGVLTSKSGNGIAVGAGGKSGGIATLGTFGGNIVNNGSITTTVKGNGIAVSASGTGAGSNALFSTFAGSVTNNGSIIAINSGIAVGAAAKLGGTATLITFGGSIINAASGTITSASGNGIAVAVGGKTGGHAALTVFDGNIVNNGSISTTVKGIGIFVGASGTGAAAIAQLSTFAGGVTNNGKIVAFSTGIFVGANAKTKGFSTVETFAGGITNSGTITSTTKTGIIVAAVAGTASDASITSFGGGIINNGKINAPVGAGIFIGGTATGGAATFGTFTGGITNNGTITVIDDGISVGVAGVRATGGVAGTATLSTFVGNVVNAGTITAGTDFGIQIAATGMGVGSTGTLLLFSGGVTNTGKIMSGGSGIAVQVVAPSQGIAVISNFTGGITNSGTIIAAGTALLPGRNGVVVGGIATQGTAAPALGVGGGTATLSTFGGSIVNNGFIGAKTGNAIFVGGTATKGGSVTIVSFVGGITNTGTVSAAAKNGIFVGGVTKSAGTVTIDNFLGGITNSGLITAAAGVGIFLGGAGAVSIGNFAANVSNAGTITARTGIVVGPGVVFTGGAAIVNTGTITGTGGSAIVLVDANHPVTIDVNGGAINGNMLGGLLTTDTLNFNIGAGKTFTYNNDFTNFNTTNINSGTVVLNGTDSTTFLNVNSGGILAGTGTLDPTTVIAGGGTLEPGTPGGFGTLTINGSLTFSNNTSIYLLTIGPGAGNNSATAVTGAPGTATLNSATGVVNVLPGHYAAATYVVLSTPAAGDVVGTFSGPTPSATSHFTGTLTFTYPGAQFVDLTVNGSSLIVAPTGTNLNVNQSNVLGGLNNAFLNGPANQPVPAAITNLINLKGAAFASALTQIDGELATDAAKGVFLLNDQFLQLMLDPFVYGHGGAVGGNQFAAEQQSELPPDVALAYDAMLKKAPPERQDFDRRWSAWGAAYGGASTTDGNATIGSNNVHASDFGVAGGVDYHVTPSTLYGFALAGGGTNWNLAQNLGNGRSDAFQAGAYGKTFWGPAYIGAAVAFANHWFTTNRIALGDQLRATFDGQAYSGRVEAGYRYGMPGADAVAGVTPYAAIQAQAFHTPNYSEADLTGGGLGLTYASQTATDTRSELGARFDSLQVVNSMPLILRARLAWAHDWVSNSALNAVFQTLPGSNFVVNGAAPPTDSALVTGAAELHMTANWSLVGKFDGDFGKGSQTYAGTGTLRYQW